MEEDQLRTLFLVVLLCFLALFFIVESLMATHPPPIGHTTGIIVMLGILMSFIILKIA